MRVIAVIGDIVRSSSIKQRTSFQKRFHRAVEQLNRNYTFASPYTVTLGDEFQAVYRDATLIFDHIFMLTADLHPQRLRISIAVGAITTELNPRQSIGMDGPAFHVARECIELMRKSGESICVRSDNRNIELEECTVKLISRLIRGWRPTRWQILRKLVEEKPVVTIANELGITPAAVYKNMDRGSLTLLLESGRAIGQSLTTKNKASK